MDLVASVLTVLLGVGGTAGIVIDKTVTDLVRGNLAKAEQLEVRVDNVPNYQVLQGKVDRVRLAGRGLYPVPFLRIDAVDLESDPIDVDADALRNNGKLILRRPLQAAIRVRLRADDITAALRAPEVAKSFKGIKIDFSGQNADDAETFDIVNPEVQFLRGNRVRLTAVLKAYPSLKQPNPQPVDVRAEADLQVKGGTQLEIANPKVSLDGAEFPEQITSSFTRGLNQLLDLKQLNDVGIQARVLQLELGENYLQVVGFARMEDANRFTAGGNR
ncbi:MAG: DUF2993 domain-containing protein [Pseudanabaenaceae cyanobacterium]|jgi:hypothetical protein